MKNIIQGRFMYIQSILDYLIAKILLLAKNENICSHMYIIMG
jgi:hypothetical protein